MTRREVVCSCGNRWNLDTKPYPPCYLAQNDHFARNPTHVWWIEHDGKALDRPKTATSSAASSSPR